MGNEVVDARCFFSCRPRERTRRRETVETGYAGDGGVAEEKKLIARFLLIDRLTRPPFVAGPRQLASREIS